MRERAIDALLLALTDFGQVSVMVNGGRGGRKRSTVAHPLFALRLTDANPKQTCAKDEADIQLQDAFRRNQSPHRTQILRIRLGQLSNSDCHLFPFGMARVTSYEPGGNPPPGPGKKVSTLFRRVKSCVLPPVPSVHTSDRSRLACSRSAYSRSANSRSA